MASPRDFHTRFLLPFYVRRDSVAAAEQSLRAARLGRGALWEPGQPRRYYRDGTTDEVFHLLFGAGEGGDPQATYLVGGEALVRAFKGVQVELCGATLGVHLEARAGIELFLNRYGFGLLSINLRPHDPLPGFEVLTQFNYEISQLDRRVGVEASFGIPHPRNDPERWQKIPEDKRQKLEAELQELPAEDSPIAARLGKRGTHFVLSELISEILAPLAEFELVRLQHELVVFTVARLGHDVDFASPDAQEQWLPIVSRLAQAEEAQHAGSATQDILVAHATLNRKHAAAVSLQGSAHFVADQLQRKGEALVDAPFNEERILRARDRYFVPYLVALQERVVLRKLSREAQLLLSSWGEGSPAAFSALRAAALDFAASGCPPEVSLRSALHGYYRLAQAGLDIDANLSRVRQAITDMDTMVSAGRMEETVRRQTELALGQTELTHQMAETVKSGHAMHVALEWIEIFIASAYGAELWHTLAPEALHHKAVGLGVALLCGGVTAMVLKPWKKGHHG